MGVIINGVEHNVGTAAVNRSLRKDYKYKVTTEDGVTHSEVRATYLDFALSLGNLDSAAYDHLMTALLGADGDITITLPASRNGSETYTGQFDGVKDSLIAQNDDESFWDNLTLNFIGTVPLEVGSL